MSDTTVKFTYRNWKGEVSERTVTPIEIEYKSTQHHTGHQWFLRGHCHDKSAIRDFAIEDILSPIRHEAARVNVPVDPKSV